MSSQPSYHKRPNYEVRIRDDSTIDLSMVEEWIDSRWGREGSRGYHATRAAIGETWALGSQAVLKDYLVWRVSLRVWAFENKEDAMEFKLVWG